MTKFLSKNFRIDL